MNLNLTWRNKAGSVGEYLVGHGIVLAGYDMRLTRDQKEWVGRISLPGLKKSLIVEGETREEVKKQLEGVVQSWFNKLFGEENNIEIKTLGA